MLAIVIWISVKASFYYKRKQVWEVGGRTSVFNEMCYIMSTTETFEIRKANIL